MALPSAPDSISMSQVNTELFRSATATINLNDTEVRNLAGVGGSGTIISMSDLRGKSAVSLAFNNAQDFEVEGPSGSIAFATIILQTNGGIIYDVAPESPTVFGPTAYLSPLQTNAGAQYEARLSTYSVTINGSGSAQALNVNHTSNVIGASTSYVALSQQRIIQVFPSQGDEVFMSFTLQIRKIGTTTPVISRSGSAYAYYS